MNLKASASSSPTEAIAQRFFDDLDRSITALYAQLLAKVEHVEEMQALIHARYRARLCALPDADRERFLAREMAALSCQSQETRAEELLETWVLENIWRERSKRGTPGAEFRRRWGYPPSPHLVLNGPDGSEFLAISNSVPIILKRVRGFVMLYRRLTGSPVHRGRKAGTRGVGIEPTEAFFLAYLFEIQRKTKVSLLRLCGKATTHDAYRWLDRRLTFGHDMLARLSSSQIARLGETLGVPFIEDVVRHAVDPMSTS